MPTKEWYQIKKEEWYCKYCNEIIIETYEKDKCPNCGSKIEKIKILWTIHEPAANEKLNNDKENE